MVANYMCQLQIRLSNDGLQNANFNDIFTQILV